VCGAAYGCIMGYIYIYMVLHMAVQWDIYIYMVLHMAV
jgi:hypothetical protein